MRKQPFIGHLSELRKRIVFPIILFVVLFILLTAFSRPIIFFFKEFLVKNLPGIDLVSLSPVEVIYAQLNVGLIISLILVIPVLILQVLNFIKPAFKIKERKIIKLFFPLFLILYLAGLAFGFFIFAKIALIFFIKLSQDLLITNLWSINKFIIFILTSCFIFAVLFQAPLLLNLLSRLGILNKKLIKRKRSYIYVFILLFSALITPPDPVTLLVLSIPLILLFELGVLFMK